MSIRVQVILDEAERDRFRSAAQSRGQSLSAWLRDAGRERAAREKTPPLRSRGALEAFFAECDRRETGREPDWSEHLEVIARSRASGRAET